MDRAIDFFPRDESMLEACFFGFEQPYSETLAKMHSFHELVSNHKIANQLMLLEHAPVITLTRQHLDKSIKTSLEIIEASKIAVAIADRGGDATFHGPGQLVGYPIIALTKNNDFFDISYYISSLQAALLGSIHALGIRSAQLVPGFTGIWIRSVENERIVLKKLVAIGVGLKNGTTKHGFAINIDIDYPRYLKHIIPCGLKDRGVITLKEAFCQESLEMPSYFAMVKTVSESLARTFSLTLQWRTEESHPKPSFGA